MRLKESGKIVVASFGETAASGGYYVGAAADKIVALPSTLTGSIGVISVVPNLEELYKMIGYEEYVFKSGPHKDMLSASRPITAEEEEIMQDITNDIYDQFLDAVVEGRGLPKEKVRQLADGRVYSGNQAKEVGLVDELGGQREAIELAAKLAGIEGEPEVVEYSRTPGVFDILRNVQLFTPNPFDSLPTYTTIKY
ncbi:MAG: signal peptide peptidase SppA [Syntrophaceticus sp.]